MSFLGLPAEPSWAEHVLGVVEAEERIKPLDGIGCRPVLISATTEEVLEWIGDGLRSRVLSFPERNGPISLASMQPGDNPKIIPVDLRSVSCDQVTSE